MIVHRKLTHLYRRRQCISCQS